MQSQNSLNPSKIIGLWLLVGVVMILVQIILGGITRLTGSGLSITEWKPIIGFLPPLNEAEWLQAFYKYQQLAQFKKLNAHFNLSDFKFIFFWEWFHRLWGRLLGLAFLIPFIVFLIKGFLKKDMIGPLIVLFLLGGLQGLIGWIMVQSGLNNEDLYVSHIRLAIHFMAAILLLVFTFWFALKVLVPKVEFRSTIYLRKFAIVITIVLCIQLTYGALMAGLKAGVFAPTWPDINGSMLPEAVSSIHNAQLSAFINDPLAVHFIHRNLAYIITILIFIWTLQSWKEKTNWNLNSIKWMPLLFVSAQVVLGIYATLTSYKAIPQGWGVFEWMAILHQVVGILLLLSMIGVIYVGRKRKGLY